MGFNVCGTIFGLRRVNFRKEPFVELKGGPKESRRFAGPSGRGTIEGKQQRGIWLGF